MKKIGVVLSGCGVADGSEIHEAVFTLLAIDRMGAEAVCMAPNADFPATNHLVMQESGDKRNALVESARIARGKIQDIQEVKADQLDAIIFPGGYGAAKNLCDFAMQGAAASVHPEIARLVLEIVAAGKPIGAICISPALIAAVLGRELEPTLTIGNDSGTAAEIEKTGARHQDCAMREIVIDRKNKIVSTPAYMLAGHISEVCDGIDRCVREVIAMA